MKVSSYVAPVTALYLTCGYFQFYHEQVVADKIEARKLYKVDSGGDNATRLFSIAVHPDTFGKWLRLVESLKEADQSWPNVGAKFSVRYKKRKLIYTIKEFSMEERKLLMESDYFSSIFTIKAINIGEGCCTLFKTSLTYTTSLLFHDILGPMLKHSLQTKLNTSLTDLEHLSNNLSHYYERIKSNKIRNL